MRLIFSQILAVNRYRPHDALVLDGQPQLVGFMIEPSGEFCDTCCDLTFEELSEPMVAGVVSGVHLCDSTNGAGSIAGDDLHDIPRASSDWRVAPVCGKCIGIVCQPRYHDAALRCAQPPKRRFDLSLAVRMDARDRAAASAG